MATISLTNLDQGLTLHNIASQLQTAQPDLIIVIVNGALLKTYSTADNLPVAARVTSYSRQPFFSCTLESIDAQRNSYTLFSLTSVEKILPDLINKHPFYDPRSVAVIVDGRTCYMQKCKITPLSKARLVQIPSITTQCKE